MIDQCGRKIDYLRISITDRCNLRCIYCMPEGGVHSLSHEDVLNFDEICRVVKASAALGVHHLRITGGEPMVRKDCLSLIAQLHAIPGIETISMTTNALLLDGHIQEARDAGLSALNISMDTLDPMLFHQMTRGGDVTRVLAVIDEALALGMKVKINAVPVAGLNESGLTDLAALSRDRKLCVRFIELMPVGCGANLTPIPTDRIRQMMSEAFGTLIPDGIKHGFGPAKYVRPEGFTGSIGFISPISHEFCDQCNRVRLTADGFLKLCLNHQAGTDLRTLLRHGITEEDLTAVLAEAIAHKPQRHGFHESIPDKDTRRMNQIGG